MTPPPKFQLHLSEAMLKAEGIMQKMTNYPKTGSASQVSGQYGWNICRFRQAYPSGKCEFSYQSSGHANNKELKRIAVEESRLRISIIIGKGCDNMAYYCVSLSIRSRRPQNGVNKVEAGAKNWPLIEAQQAGE